MKIEMCDEFYYRVQDRDFYTFLNTSKENVLRNNSKIACYRGELLKIKLNKFITHHVKPMETIKAIACKYNVDEKEIIRTNNLLENKLFIGQSLKIYLPKYKQKSPQ